MKIFSVNCLYLVQIKGFAYLCTETKQFSRQNGMLSPLRAAQWGLLLGASLAVQRRHGVAVHHVHGFFGCGA